MGPQSAAQRTVRFGDFEVDLLTGQLWHQGRRVELQDQPFQVLAVLVRRPGEVVTREELHQALWPANTFVEFDQGLNTAIKKIRHALGDSVQNPRFIETLPRKGYRFIAQLEGHEPPSAEPESERRRSLLWTATACLILISVVGAVWLSTRNQSALLQASVPVPLTTYPGEEWSSSFSPDGTGVAFRWQRPGQDYGDIYVKQIGENEPLQLTHGRGNNFCPAWSPDGRTIAFLRESQFGTSVMLMPSIGGPERKLTETLPAVYASCMAWDINSLSLIVSNRNTAGNAGGCLRSRWKAARRGV